ncbi:40178_t:CDS:1, partial [Gigaspora margarita]
CWQHEPDQRPSIQIFQCVFEDLNAFDSRNDMMENNDSKYLMID